LHEDLGHPESDPLFEKEIRREASLRKHSYEETELAKSPVSVRFKKPAFIAISTEEKMRH
jgi:hypothetical protein